MFKRLVPGARSGRVQLKKAVTEGDHATFAVFGIDAIGSTIGKQGAVVKQMASELGFKSIKVVERAGE